MPIPVIDVADQRDRVSEGTTAKPSAKGCPDCSPTPTPSNLKTHNYHWNITGPMFQTLHLMFETQYNELALAVDQTPGKRPWPPVTLEPTAALPGGRKTGTQG